MSDGCCGWGYSAWHCGWYGGGAYYHGALTTGTPRGMEATTAAARPHMDHMAVRTGPMAITPPLGLMREARRLRRPMANKRSDRRTTHTQAPTALLIKNPTPTEVPGAQPSQRTARPLTRNMRRARYGSAAQPNPQTATAMRLQTGTPTRIPGAAGRKTQTEAGTVFRSQVPAPCLIQHTVGEVAQSNPIRADRRPSAAGVATLAEKVGWLGLAHVEFTWLGQPRRRRRLGWWRFSWWWRRLSPLIGKRGSEPR